MKTEQYPRGNSAPNELHSSEELADAVHKELGLDGKDVDLTPDQKLTKANKALDAMTQLAERTGELLDIVVADLVEDANTQRTGPFIERADLVAFQEVLMEKGNARKTTTALNDALRVNPHPFMSAMDVIVATQGEQGGKEVIAALDAAHNSSEEESRAQEALNIRIEKAIDACEFERTPEVERAIEGYYSDHYGLVKEIRKVIAGSEDTRAHEDASPQTFVMKKITEILHTPERSRAMQLQKTDEIISKYLFKENALPATTIGEEEISLLGALHSEVRDAARQEGLLRSRDNGEEVWRDDAGVFVPKGEVRYDRQLITPRFVELQQESRLHQKDMFWDDTRHAGQLLFHNTPFMDQISRNDVGEGSWRLSSRSSQLEQSGRFNETTGSMPGPSDGSHSNLLHWSENFSPHHYKVNHALRMEGKDRPGTIAVPIAEMIEQVPYARDAEYAVLQPKDTSILEHIPQNDEVYWMGNSGSNDTPGRSGNDRVFLANNVDEAKGVNYELDVGRAMSTDRGNTSYKLFAVDEMEHVYGDGEGYPGTVILPYETRSTANARENKAKLEQAIRELNESSKQRPEFAGKVIVPLRRGVVEFEHDTFMTQDIPRGRGYQNRRVVVHH